jgi:hypothetical protein
MVFWENAFFGYDLLDCNLFASILFAGKLIRGKMHTHNAVFKESFFFAARPDQLGLNDGKFYGEKVFHTLSLKALGTQCYVTISDSLFVIF